MVAGGSGPGGSTEGVSGATNLKEVSVTCQSLL